MLPPHRLCTRPEPAAPRHPSPTYSPHFPPPSFTQQVLSASIPAIQQHYRELQPVALGTLCSLLHTLRGSLARPGEQGGAALALAPKALRALRQALANASKLPTDQGVSGATVAGLLFGFVAAAAPGDGGDLGDEADEAVVEVAAAALDCVADLQAKFFAAHEAQEMLEVVVPRLQASNLQHVLLLCLPCCAGSVSGWAGHSLLLCHQEASPASWLHGGHGCMPLWHITPAPPRLSPPLAAGHVCPGAPAVGARAAAGRQPPPAGRPAADRLCAPAHPVFHHSAQVLTPGSCNAYMCIGRRFMMRRRPYVRAPTQPRPAPHPSALSRLVLAWRPC